MSRVLTLLVLLVTSSALADPGPVDALAAQLSTAIDKGDRALLPSICTESFLGRTAADEAECTAPLEAEFKGGPIGVECAPSPAPPNESCEGILAQATRKKLSFQVHQTQVSESVPDRAVVVEVAEQGGARGAVLEHRRRRAKQLAQIFLRRVLGVFDRHAR